MAKRNTAVDDDLAAAAGIEVAASADSEHPNPFLGPDPGSAGLVEDGDPEFAVDMSQAEEIVAGTYPVRISTWEVVQSKAGNPMYKVSVALPTGRKLFMNLSMLPSALWKVGLVLASIGIHPKQGEKIARFKRSEVVGKIMLAKVAITKNPNTGEDQATILKTLPPTQEAINAFSEVADL